MDEGLPPPPPPPPRPPGGAGGRGGAAAALRKQALMGAARSGFHVPSTVLEEGGGDPAPERAPEPEAAGSSGRSVELRQWSDYWDDRKTVEIPGRWGCGARAGFRRCWRGVGAI
jgi:hypothetical protein